MLTATVVNGDEVEVRLAGSVSPPPPPPPSGFVTITGFTDDTGTVGDGVTTDATPTIFGLATLGTTVSIIRNGTTIATGHPGRRCGRLELLQP